MVMQNQKQRGHKKATVLFNVLANICGTNKLKWPRCLSLLKKILNLEEILTTKKNSNLPFAFRCCSLLRLFVSLV